MRNRPIKGYVHEHPATIWAAREPPLAGAHLHRFRFSKIGGFEATAASMASKRMGPRPLPPVSQSWSILFEVPRQCRPSSPRNIGESALRDYGSWSLYRRSSQRRPHRRSLAKASVLNIVTKTVADIPHTEVESRFGSFDTYDAWLLKRSRLGAFDLAVSLNGRTTAGYDATIQADAQTASDRRQLNRARD